MVNQFLHLRELQPAAIGRQRYVFVHPDDPGLVVKVVTEGYAERRSPSGGRLYKRWRKRLERLRHHQVFMREIREQLAVRAAERKLPRHLQDVVGFVETDIGMGVVSRAVRDRDGELAPTLQTLLEEGRFNEAMRRHLDEFFEWLLEFAVVVGDLNAGNIVYGYDPAWGDHFVVIDGIGDKNIIPLSSISARLNRLNKRRRIARINADVARHTRNVPAAPAIRHPPRSFAQAADNAG